MPFQEWSTNYPTSQDTGTNAVDQQQTLDNDPSSTPTVTPATDGSNTRVSHVHTLRNKLQALALKVGDDSNLPSGSLSARSPSSDQKDALAGTDGTPSTSNKYVTNSDARNTNSRAPNGSASGDLSGTYPGPSVAKLTETTGPTSLTIGRIADTHTLARSSAGIVGLADTPNLATVGWGAAYLSADISFAYATGTLIPFNRLAGGGNGSVVFQSDGKFRLRAGRTYMVGMYFRPVMAEGSNNQAYLHDYTAAASILNSDGTLWPQYRAIEQGSTGPTPFFNVHNQAAFATITPTVDSVYGMLLYDSAGLVTGVYGGQAGTWLTVYEIGAKQAFARQRNSSAGQSVSVGTKVAYDEATAFSRGSISVATDTDFTLPVGSLYRVRTGAKFRRSSATDSIALEIQRVSDNTPLSKRSLDVTYDSTTATTNDTKVVETIIDCRSAAEVIDFEVAAVSGGFEMANPEAGATIYIEEIPQESTCLYAVRSSTQSTVSAGTAVQFDTATVSRGIPLSAGSFTLKGGRTYAIRCGLVFTMSDANVTYGLRKTTGSVEVSNAPRVKTHRRQADAANDNQNSRMEFDYILEVPEGQDAGYEMFVQAIASGTVDILADYAWLTVVELPKAGDDARLLVRKNSTGTVFGPEGRLNLIEGSNVTLTVAQDSTDGEVDVTIAAASGGGGWGDTQVDTTTTVTTVNNTQATAYTYTTATNSRAITLDLIVTARDGTTGDVSQWAFVGTAFRNSGGTVSIKNIAHYITPYEDDATWDVTLDVSGSDIRVRVTGDASNTVNWRVEGGISER